MRIVVAILIAIVYTLPFPCFGQDPRESTPSGLFTVLEYQGCAPLTVTVNAPTCTGSPPGASCTMLKNYNATAGTYEESKGFVITDSYTFTTPGTHKITVVTNGGIQEDIQIKVYPNTAPTFDLYACNGNKASVSITDINYEMYKIQSPVTTIFSPMGAPPQTISLPATGLNNVHVTGQFSDADNSQCLTNVKSVFSQPTLDAPIINLLSVVSNNQIDLSFPLATDQHQNNTQYQLFYNATGGIYSAYAANIINQSSRTVTGISTENNYYCFKLVPFDRCLNQLQQSLASPEICSIKFGSQDVVVGNEVNDLTWTTVSPDQDFNIDRTPDLPIQVGAAQRSHSHQPVTCGTNYSYQITGRYLNGAQSVSATVEKVATSNNNPDPIANITASLNPDGTTADLIWDAQSLDATYSISRNQRIIAETQSITYTDNAYKKDACYEVKFTDNCGNDSKTPHRTACPIYLNASLASNNDVVLSWNAYEGWDGGAGAIVNYTIEKYTTDNALVETSFENGTSHPDANDPDGPQSFIYVVKANPNDPTLGQAISNAVLVIKDPNIYQPTAFDPNADDTRNRSFKVLGKFIDKFEMQIFNRWGEIVFSTDNMEQGWDGTHKMLPAPAGIYAFIARLTDSVGREFTRSGTVMLLRKK